MNHAQWVLPLGGFDPSIFFGFARASKKRQVVEDLPVSKTEFGEPLVATEMPDHADHDALDKQLTSWKEIWVAIIFRLQIRLAVLHQVAL